MLTLGILLGGRNRVNMLVVLPGRTLAQRAPSSRHLLRNPVLKKIEEVGSVLSIYELSTKVISTHFHLRDLREVDNFGIIGGPRCRWTTRFEQIFAVDMHCIFFSLRSI